MRRSAKPSLLAAVALLLVLFSTTPLPGQAAERRESFSLLGGWSFDSPTLIGRTGDARLGIVDFRYTRTILTKGDISLKYTLDVIPMALLDYPRTEAGPAEHATGRKSVYGGGLAPIGLQLNLPVWYRLQPFVGASGGFIYFSERVPTSNATRLNFTGDLGAGIEVLTSPNTAITIGYKYHHISNGYTGRENPGVDSNIFYTGFSIFR